MRRRRAVAAALAVSALVPISQQTASASPVVAPVADAIPVALKAHSLPLGPQAAKLPTPSPVVGAVELTQEKLRAERVHVREAKRAAKRAAIKRAAAKRKALAAAKPDFVRPTNGRLTSGYGARWGTMHSGIDLANSLGTPIVAAADGEVVEAGPASGFGLWVQIKHDDGTITVYGHMYEFSVSVGQRVKAGDQIATIGSNGQSTGPHLHFEVWQGGGTKIDPIAWLSQHGVNL